jgi:hypothetical protein
MHDVTGEFIVVTPDGSRLWFDDKDHFLNFASAVAKLAERVKDNQYGE